MASGTSRLLSTFQSHASSVKGGGGQTSVNIPDPRLFSVRRRWSNSCQHPRAMPLLFKELVRLLSTFQSHASSVKGGGGQTPVNIPEPRPFSVKRNWPVEPADAFRCQQGALQMKITPASVWFFKHVLCMQCCFTIHILSSQHGYTGDKMYVFAHT